MLKTRKDEMMPFIEFHADLKTVADKLSTLEPEELAIFLDRLTNAIIEYRVPSIGAINQPEVKAELIRNTFGDFALKIREEVGHDAIVFLNLLAGRI